MKIRVGGVYDTENNGKFEVVKQIKFDLFTVRFIETNFTTDAYFSAITKGQVKDSLKPSVYNVGILGYANKVDNKKYYSLWQRMLRRCYDKSHKDYKYYGEKDIVVCERWHRFDYFLEDVKKVDGFIESKFLNGELELDKDIKQFDKDVKEYNILNCCFVSKLENIKHRKFSIQKKFIAISPSGEIHNHINIREFCRDFDLTATHVSRCLNEKALSHKGWMFKYI